MLVSPVDSAWQVLKGHILKAAMGEPPDNTERELINDICYEDGKNASTILKMHSENEKLLVRIDEIIKKYDSNWNLSSVSGQEPISSAVTEDGHSLWPAGCETALFEATSKLSREHYRRMSSSSGEFTSDKQIMLLSNHPDENAAAMLTERIRDLVEQNPDTHDDSKKDMMIRLENHIAELDSSAKAEKLIRARMNGHENEEGYEDRIREVLHNQHRMKVLKTHYRDRAASEVVGELQGVKKHYSTCDEQGVIGFPNCDCPSILESQRADFLSRDQRMGSRHKDRHWENEGLKSGVADSINSLVSIMVEYGGMSDSDTRSNDTGSREDRMLHWWKNTPSDQRQVILGIQSEYHGTHQPMFTELLNDWLEPEDRDKFFHSICNFEGAKSRRRRGSAGARGRIATTDPSIIGKWSANDLYHYLNPEESFASVDTVSDEHSLGDTTYEDVESSSASMYDDTGGGTTVGEGGIDAWEHAEGLDPDTSLTTDIADEHEGQGTSSTRGGRKSGKTPFPIYTYRWFDTDNEHKDWKADMKDRVKLSEGKGERVTVRREGKEEKVPLLDTNHPNYMSQAQMNDIVGRHAFAADCILNLNQQNAKDLLKQKRDHLQKEKDDRKVLYDSEARKSGISPKTMELALVTLGFIETPEGQRWQKLNKALFIDSTFRKENPDHILDSPIGRAAINNLLQGAEKHREAAGQTVRTIPCPKCNGSLKSTKRSSGKGGRLIDCKKCPDPFTGKPTGVVTAYREVDVSPEQKSELVESLHKEHDDIRANFIPQIRRLADEADFTKQCQTCEGSGEDDILRDKRGRPEACLSCDGYGSEIYLESFLDDIFKSQEQGLSAREARDMAIKAAARRHSVLNYRNRERLHHKRMSDMEKHGILSNGIPALFYMNDLHQEIGGNGGGVLNRKALESHRKEVLEDSPDIGFHRLKQELADRLLKVFKYIDRNHGYHGLTLAKAIHSPYFDELLNILSERPHLGEATDVTSAKLKRHLMEINSPEVFEHRPAYRVCPSCEGTKKERHHHNHSFIEGSSCSRCSIRGKPPTGYIQDRRAHNVSRVFDLPEIRSGVPSCPCCEDGVSQMVNSPGGFGKSTKIYHYPIDFDYDSMTRMDNIFVLHEKLKRAQTKFSNDPNDGNKKRAIEISDALNDAIEEETPLLTKTLGMSFERAQARTGKTGRSMEAFLGGEREGEEYRDYGVSYLERPSDAERGSKWEPTVKSTPCPFCAEANKRNEQMHDEFKGKTPMLGDKDGYHGRKNFLTKPKGCPNDAHNEDGASIFRQMYEVKHFYKTKKFMSDELEHQDMLNLIEESWSKGPVIDDLRKSFRSVSKASPEEKQVWLERNPGKSLKDFFKEKTQKARDREVYSPRPPQTIGDYMFNKFAALRRREGKPTPQERIDHEGASNYLSTGLAKVRPISNLQKSDYGGGSISPESFTQGELHLDKLDSSGVLDFEDGSFTNEHELKRLFAIHVLVPDYYGHRHYNPLYLTGGESEKDLRKWARGVLSLKKNHPVGEEMKAEFKHNLHMIEPLLQLEKEWSHYYLAPRQDMVQDSGWPESIFNTTDSKQPFFNQKDIQRVFGELRGHYRDWRELMKYGHYSADHHGFLPPTVHFPDLCYFLNNPDMLEWVAKAWFAHDDEQLSEGAEWLQTKGKSMEEMQELANVLWAAGQGDQNHEGEYPPSVEWMEEDREDGNEADESTKMLWFRIRDMLQRRSRDPEGSRLALEALMHTRNRTQLNHWGFPTACTSCKGEGQVTPSKFLEHSPAFIDMVDKDGSFSDVPLDREGVPLEKVSGQYQMNDPKVHQFFKDHARSYSHPNWVDHKEYNKDDPHWKRHVMMQCPGCKGTHVCPSCDGHTGRHHSSPVMNMVRNIRNMLHKEAMAFGGRFIRQPVMEDGPVEMQTDTRSAKINDRPTETLGDYENYQTRAQKPPMTYDRPEVGYLKTYRGGQGKRPPSEDDRKEQVDEGGSGVLWVEEKDDEDEPTGYYYTLRDPWLSNTGGMGVHASFERELQRVTADELFGGLSEEEWYDREDKRDSESAKRAELWNIHERAKNIREGVRWDPDAQSPPKAVQEMIDRNLTDETLKPSQCLFPGCKQQITLGQKYCTGEEEYPHITVGAGGRKFMEMTPTGEEAPNHFALTESPHYKNTVLNSAMPSKNYWGGREPVEKMLELGYKLEGSKRFGARQDIDVEAHKEFVKSDFARILNELGFRPPQISESREDTSTPYPHMSRLRGRNKLYHRLMNQLERGDISQKEFEKKRQVRDEEMPSKGGSKAYPYVDEKGKPLPGIELTKVPWALNDDEFEEKAEEMRKEWFKVTQEAVAAWRNTIEKTDMHIPYFTHPSSPGRVFTPFDIFDSGGIPEDHLNNMFDYIPHGLDPDNNPNHRGSWKTASGDKVGVYSVQKAQVCNRCWSSLSKEERDNLECDTCGEQLASEDDIDTSMMSIPQTALEVQSSGSRLPRTPSDSPHATSHVNTAKHPDLPRMLQHRDKLRSRAAYIAEHMDTESGEFDPALIQCNYCGGHGELQDKHGNPVKCSHCVEIPDFASELGEYNHMTFNDFDKDAIIQIHTPNYQLLKGNPQDPDSWKPIDGDDKEEFEKALMSLKLGAGGSKMAGRLLGSEALQRLTTLHAKGDIKGLEEVEDEDKAKKAEHYLRTFLQIDHDGKHSPVSIPTMNLGLMSNNQWNNEKGGSPLAKFSGYHSARNKVQKEVNEHFNSASHDLLGRELFRLTGAKHYSDLGTPGLGGGQKQEDGSMQFPSWKHSPKIKKLAKSNMKSLENLQKKKSLSEIDQAKLEDALLLKMFIGEGKRPAWEQGLGNPIAIAHAAESGTEGYMLYPKEGFSGIDRDISESVLRGAILGNDTRSSAEFATDILTGILDNNDNNHWAEKGIGSFGTAGLEYTNALRNIVNRGESAFFLGGPKLGTIMDSSQVAHGEMRSEGALMKNALFTPSGLHDEAHRAYGEGRDDHGDQYMQALGHVFKGTGIDAPIKNDEEIEMGKPLPHSSISPQDAGQTPPVPTEGPSPMSGDSPAVEQARQWGASDESFTLSDDPMVNAWDTILKNLKITQ